MTSFLTQAQLDQFNTDGYLIIENVISSEQARALKEYSDTILETMIQSIDHPISPTSNQSNNQPMKHPMTVFKTSNNQKQTSDFKQVESINGASNNQPINQSSIGLPENTLDDRYFLNTADSIGFFFEPGAIRGSTDPKSEQSVEFLVPKNQSINKVGHFLHVLDPVFRDFTNHLKVSASNQSTNQSTSPSTNKPVTDSSNQSPIKQIATDLGFVDPIVLQSMLICKQPNIGGRVDKHRDSTFLHTQSISQSTDQSTDQSISKPARLVGFWFPLEDADAENGCLSFVKGSHLNHNSTRWFGRIGHTEPSINNIPANERSKCNVESLTGPDNVHCKTGFRGVDNTIDQYPDEDWKLAPVKAGSLVLIHGDVAHMSTLNQSKRSRYAYTFHIIDDHQTLYPVENWLQSAKVFPHLQ